MKFLDVCFLLDEVVHFGCFYVFNSVLKTKKIINGVSNMCVNGNYEY